LGATGLGDREGGDAVNSRTIPADLTRGAAVPRNATGALDLVWSALGLCIIAGLGLLRLDDPLHGDQALFLFYAQQMDQGARLYVDVWDVKQPGIFLFAWAAGTLFGFSFESLHRLGLIWMLATALVMVACLRPQLRHRWLAVVAPLASLAVYYVQAEPQFQTQLEILVGLPLFLTAWFLARASEWPGGRAGLALAAGVAAALATVFKHVFAPLPVAFLIVVTVRILISGEERRLPAVLFKLWAPFTLGVIAVWGAVFATFAALGTFEAFFDANFAYPLEALTAPVPGAPPFGRLVGSLAFFVAAFSPWWIFVLLTLPGLIRRDEPVLTWLMWTWLGVGGLLVAIQVNAWWPYQTLLLFLAPGVLAVRGIDQALTWVRETRPLRPVAAMAVSTVLVLPAVGGQIHPAGELAQRFFGFEFGRSYDLEQFRRLFNAEYKDVAEAADFARTLAAPGPIYVFGSPVIQFQSGRAQAIPIHGWAWELMLARQWAQLAPGLERTRPAAIFINKPEYDPLLRARAPEVMAWIENAYALGWSGAYGRWYVRRDGSAGSPEAGSGAVQ
jgi:hypothetical protein